MYGLILMALVGGNADLVSVPLGAYSLPEAIRLLYPAHASEELQVAPELRGEAGIFGFDKKLRVEAKGAIEGAFGVTISESGKNVVVMRDRAVTIRDREWLDGLAKILAAQVIERSSVYVSASNQLNAGADYDEVSATAHMSFLDVHSQGRPGWVTAGVMAPFGNLASMRRVLETGSDVHFYSLPDPQFPAIRAACNLTSIDPATYNSGAVGALLSVVPGQLTLRVAANAYPDDQKAWFVQSGSNTIAAQIPLETRRARRQEGPNPIVSALFAGEKGSGVWKEHQSIGASAEGFYTASKATNEVALKSGAFVNNLAELVKPSFDSLSQLVEVWAHRGGRSVVMELSPMQEQLTMLRRLPGGYTASSFRDLFGPTSPWWIEEYGDHIFIFHDRLEFLEHQWRQPLASIVAASRAIPATMNATWRHTNQGVFCMPDEVSFAFLEALVPGDKLWPYGHLDYNHYRDYSFTYRGLPLFPLTQDQIEYAAWHFRPKGSAAPTSGSHRGEYIVPFGDIPETTWHTLQDSAIYPTDWSLAMALADNRASLRNGWVSLVFGQSVKTPEGPRTLFALAGNTPDHHLFLGFPISIAGTSLP